MRLLCAYAGGNGHRQPLLPPARAATARGHTVRVIDNPGGRADRRSGARGSGWAATARSASSAAGSAAGCGLQCPDAYCRILAGPDGSLGPAASGPAA